MSQHPPCPITGKPAHRHIQSISTSFLSALWKKTFKTSTEKEFNKIRKIDLWQSDNGLCFFWPMIEGSSHFYRQFYSRISNKLQEGSGAYHIKPYISKYIAPGNKVLDVGCGRFCVLNEVLSDVVYSGLDPNFSPTHEGINVYNETLANHIKKFSNYYDTVCAFEVLEHVSDPSDFFSDMVKAAKPGGLVVISVPSAISPMTKIPNFLLNAPPHHLTWWTKESLKEIASLNNLKVETIGAAKFHGSSQTLIYWIYKCSIFKNSKYYFKHSWLIHLSSVLAYVLGSAMNMLFSKNTKNVDGASLVMLARKKEK